MSRATAEIDLGAISRNCRTLKEAASGAMLCAVVKANGYGHGMFPVAEAAIDGGADWLGVAATSEGLALRDRGVTVPVLVMGAIEKADVPVLSHAGCDIVCWTSDAVDWATAAGGARVHIKIDSGMGRLGTRDMDEAVQLARTVHADEATALVGVTTHFATADDRADDGFLEQQNSVFSEFASRVREFAPDVCAHAANSAATLRLPEAHHDMVRCGIGIYGLDPFQADPAGSGLEPAMAFRTHIASIKRAEPGDSVGYGRQFIATQTTRIATCPVGYADGVRRLAGGRVDCLVGGRRCPLVGRVSMDNIAVDIGPEGPEQVGDPVTLFGEQDGQRVLVEEWAKAAETINYEIATGIGGRTLPEYIGGS